MAEYESGADICLCEYEDWSDDLHGDNIQGVPILSVPIFEDGIYLFVAEK